MEMVVGFVILALVIPPSVSVYLKLQTAILNLEKTLNREMEYRYADHLIRTEFRTLRRVSQTGDNVFKGELWTGETVELSLKNNRLQFKRGAGNAFDAATQVSVVS